MRRGYGSLRAAAVLWLATTLGGGPLMAAGFSLIFEQGAKAMGMAGAFTATADDPSAMFFNVGGLAFLEEREFQAGLVLVTSDGTEFTGAAPYPGEGVTETMNSLAETPPHFYWVEPVNERLKLGFALNSPFGLISDWDPDGFSGRYISTLGSLTTMDLSGNVGWKVSNRLGIGVGALVRLTEVELERYQGAINPFTGQVVDIADVALKSDVENAVGWHAGFLHRVNNSFSWGFHYRAAVDMDLEGEAEFTQIPTGYPQLDAVVSGQLPFGTPLPISTSIEFPSSWSLGAAVALSRNLRMEVDYNWTEWSTFQQVAVDFGGALPDLTLNQNWDDVNNYRIGFRWLRPGASEWRFGLLYDETPQPDETVGPLLPDADREGLTVGYGRHGQGLGIDLALMVIRADSRTILVSEDGFNGTWETDALLFAGSVSW